MGFLADQKEKRRRRSKIIRIDPLGFAVKINEVETAKADALAKGQDKRFIYLDGFAAGMNWAKSGSAVDFGSMLLRGLASMQKKGDQNATGQSNTTETPKIQG